MLLLLNSKRHSPNNVMLLTREALLFRPISLRIPSFSVPNKHQEIINIEKGILTRINRNLRKKKKNCIPFFPFCIIHLWTGRSLFYQVLSHTLGIHKTAGKRRVPSFIPLYHFHQLTNMQLFTTLHARWLPRIFDRIAYNYQTATWLDLSLLRSYIWLIVLNVDFSFTWCNGELIAVIYCRQRWILNSHRPSP